MSYPADYLSEEQFSCPICLDIFTNPVSTPCGHSFCLTCITSYWDSRAKTWVCPICKESFRKRPDLHINHTLKEITEQFKRMAESSGSTATHHQPTPGTIQRPGVPLRAVELPGGLLTEMKSKFQRASSSGNLLSSPPPYEACQRRFSASGYSAGGSTGPPCPRHGLSLDLFCKNDQMCVCAMCLEGEHFGHSAIPAKREMNTKKSQLRIKEAELQGLITAREKKIEEIQIALADIQANAQQEAEVTVSMFRVLMTSMERCQAELLELVQMGRNAAELRSQALIRDLQEEIAELKKRSSSLLQLAQSTDDHITFFKAYSSLSGPPPLKSWTEVTLTPDPTAGAVLRNVTQMVENLQDELKRLPQICLRSAAESPTKRQIKVRKVEEYALDVTLDRDSAHPRLIISEDSKQVLCSDRYFTVTDTPERFDRVVCVLGRQGFNSGRHYWEVLVGDKTDWDLGVASRSINRKGKICVSPANGYWFMSLRDKNEYAFRTDPSTPILINPKPQKIGIYVDYEKGQLSFYSVDTKTHFFTYTDTFTDTLHPFFSPCTNKSGKNEGPLIICPVGPAD
uniref:Bloodthirsty-related gene family, member 1 n=1 Tax=Astyanax mexicanus TaxID=7994 RepID=W5KU23_ASTMX